MTSFHLTDNLKNSINTGLTAETQTSVFYTLSSMPGGIDAPLFVITKNDSEARRITDEISAFFNCDIMWYPKPNVTFHDLDAESPDIRAYRMKVINAVLHNKNVIIVTTPDGLATPLTPEKICF